VIQQQRNSGNASIECEQRDDAAWRFQHPSFDQRTVADTRTRTARLPAGRRPILLFSLPDSGRIPG
jgi:hypothetical protein